MKTNLIIILFVLIYMTDSFGQETPQNSDYKILEERLQNEKEKNELRIKDLENQIKSSEDKLASKNKDMDKLMEVREGYLETLMVNM